MISGAPYRLETEDWAWSHLNLGADLSSKPVCSVSPSGDALHSPLNVYFVIDPKCVSLEITHLPCICIYFPKEIV